MDALAQFKEMQKQAWTHFAPLESRTTAEAARLVKYGGVRPGDRVLDVACGTGVVAVTAARLGARVTAVDLTPELLERARENARIAGVEIDWLEGDVEQLPLPDTAFDVVLSQYGHMFAPRPEVAVSEMLRVLRPGGTIAFSTWPPEQLVGSLFALVSRYGPALPAGISPPPLWGDPHVVRERLGSAVTDIAFDRATMLVPALSPAHDREVTERTADPVRKLVESLTEHSPERLAGFRAEFERIVAAYFDSNVIRQHYLLTRAVKR